MARLPLPGSDDGTWGDILNEYLTVSHATDGTIKSGAVNSAALQDNSVSGAKVQDGTITPDKLAATNSPANGQIPSYNGTDFTWTSAGGGATNLSTTITATTATINSDTGTDALIPAANATDAGVLTAADKSKLDGIQAGAEANTVDSVFGRNGAVVAANGDYTAAQINNTPAGGIVGTTVQAAVNELDTNKAATVHTHSGSDIVSGTISLARLDNVLSFVDVTTGNEVRPAGADRVIWIGGTTEPVNMAVGDVWMQEA